jgi:hypothetical protein
MAGNEKINRRDFLKWSLAIGSSAVLAGCVPQVFAEGTSNTSSDDESDENVVSFGQDAVEMTNESGQLTDPTVGPQPSPHPEAPTEVINDGESTIVEETEGDNSPVEVIDETEPAEFAPDPVQTLSVHNFEILEQMEILYWENNEARLDPTLGGEFDGLPEGTKIYFMDNPKEMSRLSVPARRIFVSSFEKNGDLVVEIDHAFLNTPDNNGDFGFSVSNLMAKGDDFILVVELPTMPAGEDFTWPDEKSISFEVERDHQFPNNDPVDVYRYVQQLMKKLFGDKKKEDQVVFGRSTGTSAGRRIKFNFIN